MGTSEFGLHAFYIMILLQDYEGQGAECGGLDENGPHRPLGSVALLEWEMCHFNVGFEDLDTQARPSVSLVFLLPIGSDVGLSSSSPAPRLPRCHHTFHHNDNGLNL